jgi:hypothetical protein
MQFPVDNDLFLKCQINLSYVVKIKSMKQTKKKLVSRL